MKPKTVHLQETHCEQVSQLYQEHEEQIKELRKEAGLPGRNGENFLYRWMSEEGFSIVAEKLANFAHN